MCPNRLSCRYWVAGSKKRNEEKDFGGNGDWDHSPLVRPNDFSREALNPNGQSDYGHLDEKECETGSQLSR